MEYLQLAKSAGEQATNALNALESGELQEASAFIGLSNNLMRQAEFWRDEERSK